MRTVRNLRPCPACGGSSASFLTWVQLNGPAGHPLQGGFEVVTCNTCHAGFTNAEPPREYYASYYGGGGAKYESEAITPTHRAHADRAADHIRAVAPPGSRVFDIGAGAGLLVNTLRDGGYEAERDVAAGMFDVVCLQGVLEHAWDTESLMLRVKNQLRPNGHLYVEVPDAGRYHDPCSGPIDLNTEHANHFGQASLSLLLTRHGFHGTVVSETVPMGERHQTAMLIGMFQRGTSPLKAYVECSRRMMLRICNRLEGALSGHDGYAIWGAGELSFRLMALEPLRSRALVCIVDGNSARHALSFCGKQVTDPIELKSSSCPVIVASLVHTEAIVRAAADLGVSERLVILEAT